MGEWVQATITKNNGVSQEFCQKSYEALMVLVHPQMEMEIGRPAVLEPGDEYPVIKVRSNVPLRISGTVVCNGNQVITQLPLELVDRAVEKNITIPGTVPQKGLYEIRLTIKETGKAPVYDTFYFTALHPQEVPVNQSRIAFLNEENKMVYVPDFKGNRVLDFSNCGYMGGGVRIPDVPVKIAIKPIDGDATQTVQDAIDQVSNLPMDTNGFRGAVLLKKGRYNIGGTVKINASGVVLRGEGEGGTLIYGTGTAERNLLEIGSGTGPSTLGQPASEIMDLYVPSGARSFHVSDASAYRVGDTVIIRRVGNSRWIHEIGMDEIFMRPKAGGTKQWTAFNLDFDRVITAIDGNLVTVDAPIANAIERKWGGGQLIKYSDAERVERVGVEQLRVDTDFDTSITGTVMDNRFTDLYCADEKHAKTFVVFNSVKNGWARNIIGYHLSYTLVQMGRNAKWITTQDCTMLDHVSIITGGRRYSFYIQGQLNLVQRVHAETSRHAAIYDSHVPGPNVVMDSSSSRDYNTSEPHHRWSVGGLFDNVKLMISIRDRAWLGSGHGWAGANYVTWNTEGNLTSQQPPTAQNYAIGHVGKIVPGLVPNAYDPRPRKDAYWEASGSHVTPVSLYKQQLEERLGVEAVDNIRTFPVGGGSMDVPPGEDISRGGYNA